MGLMVNGVCKVDDPRVYRCVSVLWSTLYKILKIVVAATTGSRSMETKKNVSKKVNREYSCQVSSKLFHTSKEEFADKSIHRHWLFIRRHISVCVY